MRNNKVLFHAVLAAAAGVAGGCGPRETGRSDAEPARVLLVHCGNSMRPAAEELARRFSLAHGVEIQFNFGGSSSLLPHVLARREGDVLITHDPFGGVVAEAGLLDREATVGELVPVLVVPRGSGCRFRTWADLLQPGLRIGVTDPRYTTAARLVQEALHAAEGLAAFEDHPNFVLQTRTHADVATAVATGHLDVGVVWNFIAVQFADRLEHAPLPEALPATRVLVCLLSCAGEPDAAQAFLAFADSADGRAIFRAHGYGSLHP